jgi:ABC-type nickel/cobalt efflux system permease component RcnA
MMRDFLVMLVLLLAMNAPLQANPFTDGKPGESAVVEMGGMSFWGEMRQEMATMQRTLHDTIAEEMKAIRDGDSLAPFLSLLLIGFLYGVFHVLAPGHGKAIVASYFLGHDAKWREGVTAGAIMATGHTVSAIAIVVALSIVMGLSQLDVLAKARFAELGGYGLIALIGLWMLVQALRGRTHECHVCGHGHGHDHHHDHTHEHKVAKREEISLFAAGSLVPCTGSMILLLFALANSVLWAGVAAVLAVALGMWMTVSVIGFAAIFFRRMLVGEDHESGWKKKLASGLSVAAALFVVLIGSALFLSVWQAV